MLCVCVCVWYRLECDWVLAQLLKGKEAHVQKVIQPSHEKMIIILCSMYIRIISCFMRYIKWQVYMYGVIVGSPE